VTGSTRSYSDYMLRALRKLFALGAMGGLVTWWLRLLAHSKQAPAEGRWKELTLDES
jgi:hypothetical protein